MTLDRETIDRRLGALVAAIGKAGSNITVESALEHVWGYAVGLDMTRRDLQMKMREAGRPWELGKAFDLSAPIAPLRRAGPRGRGHER